MRHRFHSICPYFAMFPESFVEKQLAASPLSGVVFDPFCGRGTAVFQALLDGRDSAGCDVHPVAACVSAAKCDPPDLVEVLERLDELKKGFVKAPDDNLDEKMREFFDWCFHRETYEEVRYLRHVLEWKERRTDRFIAALCLGVLHGEARKTPNVLSNQMPRTISTKPVYSVEWWRDRGLYPEYRDTFQILTYIAEYRYRTRPPKKKGDVKLADARYAGDTFRELHGRVTDVVTSPPYIDTTNYHEDQWLRLWFLGGDAASAYSRGDGRHYGGETYWMFLEEAWKGVAPLLGAEARIVVRIGGRKLDKKQVFEGLQNSLEGGLGRTVNAADVGVTSPVKSSQANSFRGRKASPSVEHDFCFSV